MGCVSAHLSRCLLHLVVFLCLMSINDKNAAFRYRAFGLNVASEFQIPGMERADSFDRADVSVQTQATSALVSDFPEAITFKRVGCTVRVSQKKSAYNWPGIGTAIVQNGSEILVDPETGVDPQDFSAFITGALFGHILHQRGKTVLHGSAVSDGSHGIVFLGDKGAGKSTLAVSLAERGLEMLSDDLVPLTLGDEEPHTVPGFSRAKLWPDSVASLGIDPESLPKISSMFEKRSLLLDAAADGPIRLKRIFVLRYADRIDMKQMDARTAFMELVKNLYLNRYLKATDSMERSFSEVSQVIRTVPIFFLFRPLEFGSLDKVCERIIEGAGFRQTA